MLSGDKVYLSQCQRAIDIESGDTVWTEEQDNIMMASCYSITNTSDGVVALDCINGSLLSNNILSDLTNFTYLSYLSVMNNDLLDEKRRVAPPEMDLLISNESRLLINLEGCVNTLMDECKEFLRDYGRDGTDHNARARFPCFYADKDPEFVVSRFDLLTTYRQFLIAVILPSCLCIVSCLTLILCQRTVVVGDDAKMRFQGCSGKKTILSPGEKSLSSNNLADGGGGDSIMAL